MLRSNIRQTRLNIVEQLVRVGDKRKVAINHQVDRKKAFKVVGNFGTLVSEFWDLRGRGLQV